jgi:hypothetical protein
MNTLTETDVSRSIPSTPILRWATFACDAGNCTIKAFDEVNRLSGVNYKGLFRAFGEAEK